MTPGRDRRTAQALARAREDAASVARSLQLTLATAAAVGVVTGLGVAAFEQVVHPMVEHLLAADMWVVAVVPALGLTLVVLINARWGGGDATTADAYVRAYHERGGGLGIKTTARKVMLSAATLGSGSAMGFEGPALLIGGTVGSFAERRVFGKFRADDAKVLMVAGAAAGVAAIFKAPLTGVCFALEVPYRADLARRALPSALAAAGSAYVTYVLIVGTTPLFETGGSAPFDLRELGGGLALGLLCGVLARLGAWSISHAKRIPVPLLARVGLAAGALVVSVVVANEAFGGPVHLGPGYAAVEWATEADRSLALLAGLFALRAATTWVCVGAGGVGGLFIPLVTQGALLGALVQHVAPASNAALFPTIGIAAFLGAGYRTPLAGVAFVAETTGQPGFLVPALLAASTAQLVMGRQSFSAYQLGERVADVEPLTRLTLREVMSPNPDVLLATAALDTAVPEMMRDNRRWAPVIDDNGDYAGLIAVTDVAAIDPRDWAEVTVAEVAQTDAAPAAPTETVFVAAERMRAADRGALVVVDDGRVVGVVTLRDLANVEAVLDRLSDGSTHR